ncbi:het-domain-containing protein [Fusarium pseudocircinatum]|uniref:Het-domain-containing protein n=1 Tax=Fusarium pseudocircinatum TaxID=56676 RepID=A0A8H5KLX0_9HYPO|nr:het-domain-containing protein [Fusarium pseudocircinatum]
MESPQINLIEPPKIPTYTTDLPPLKYEKLPTPTSIRLLKIDRLPSINDSDLLQPITCSLVITDLNEQPKYDALSYTWGDPLGHRPDGHMFKSFDITNEDKCKILGVQPISPETARGMLGFFKRAWFKRSWIIQEALLAPKSNALFSASAIPFDDLSNFMRSLGDSSWFRKLTLLANHNYPGSLATPSFFNRLHMVTYRLGTRSFDSHDQYWKQSLPIDTVTRMFRACEATDPRDKVYAFIGITDNDVNHKGLQLLLDYSKSVEDIYIDTTKPIMSSEGFDLDCFSQKEDESLRRIKSLPSWVPDFSVDLGHNPLVARSWMFAAGPRAPKNHIRYLPSNCIEIRGSRVDAVRLWKGEVVSERPCYPGPDFAHRPYPTIHITSNDLVELMSLVPERSPIGLPSTDLSYKGEHEAKNCSPVISTTVQIVASPEQATSYQSRSEVFWRTMMKDIGNNKYPAEARCGEELFKELEQVLYLEMADLLCEEADDLMSVEEWKVRTNDVMKRFTNLQIVKGALPYGTTDTQNPKHFARVRSAILSHRDHAFDWELCTRNLYNSTLEFPSPEAYRLDVKEEVFMTAKGRGLFVTDKRRLGWGLLSTRAGDEVWILEGCRVPCLFRPSGDGRYSLVGEAYVHGIMHGEALKDPDVKGLKPVIIMSSSF